MIRYIADCRLCWRREGIRDGYRERIVFSDDQPLPQGILAVHGGAFGDFLAPSRAVALAWLTATDFLLGTAVSDP